MTLDARSKETQMFSRVPLFLSAAAAAAAATAAASGFSQDIARSAGTLDRKLTSVQFRGDHLHRKSHAFAISNSVPRENHGIWTVYREQSGTLIEKLTLTDAEMRTFLIPHLATNDSPTGCVDCIIVHRPLQDGHFV